MIFLIDIEIVVVPTRAEDGTLKELPRPTRGGLDVKSFDVKVIFSPYR